MWDWTSKTSSGINLIKNSYDAAYGEGIQLAQAITNPKKDPNRKYTYVHFIAHSAGSRVIYSASKFLKAIHPSPPFIHTTFLDAYTHADTWDNENPDNRYHDENRYACFSDFAEHYVDRDWRLPSTDQDLANAYNFDVTNLDKPALGTEFPSHYEWPNAIHMFYHYFPVDWYQQTVENLYLSSFGAANAIEFVSSPEHPKEAFYAQLKQNLASPSWNLVPGSRCLLGESLDTCEKEDFPPISIPLCTFFETDPDPISTGKYTVHMYNIDDLATLYINGEPLYKAKWGYYGTEPDWDYHGHRQGDSGEFEITPDLAPGDNSLRFTLWNEAVCCYTSLSIEVKKDGELIFVDSISISDSGSGIKYDKTIIISKE